METARERPRRLATAHAAPRLRNAAAEGPGRGGGARGVLLTVVLLDRWEVFVCLFVFQKRKLRPKKLRFFLVLAQQ